MSMKNDDEMYQSLLARFSEYQEKKRKQRLIIRCTVPAVACLCLAVLGLGRWEQLRKLPVIPDQHDIVAEPATDVNAAQETVTTVSSQAEKTSAATVQATAAATEQPTAAAESQTAVETVPCTSAEQPSERQTETTPVTQAAAQTEPPATAKPVITSTAPPVTEKPVRTTQPAVTAVPTQPATEKQADPPQDPVTPGDPGAVYTKISVSYDEAGARFRYPAAACTRSDFTGYKAGIVSRNGDISSAGSFCLSLEYDFADGSVTLTDQDIMAGKATPLSNDQREYGGRIFYVLMPEDNYGQTYVGYFPQPDSGIAYQAFFDGSRDIYEIMDIIISLEI